MKSLHRKNLFCWSEFNEERNLDFNSVLWVRADGNVLIDPLALSEHDYAHLQELGGAELIVITNSDHCRQAQAIAGRSGAKIYGPRLEQRDFPIPCDHWITDGEQIVPGLIAYELNGSKTPGELALLLQGDTLITGDLIRCHLGGDLSLLPDGKLSDKILAITSVEQLAALPGIHTVLVGDGWPIFNHGAAALQRLTETF